MREPSASHHRPGGTYLLAMPWGPEAIGGVTQVVVGLHDAIKHDGRLTPRILVASWDDAKPVEHTDENGRSIIRSRVRPPLNGGPLLSSLLHYAMALPAELWRIRALARRHSIEVINCHYVGSCEFSWIVARTLRIYRGKVILSLHGRDIRSLAATRGLARVLWRWALCRADVVVACSNALAQETIDAFGLSRAKVITIHNGVDFDRLLQIVRPGRTPTRLTQGPHLITLGTLEHKKGHDLLLAAFRHVVDRYPAAHLTIMGRHAESADSTLQLVQHLGLAANTTVTTNVPHQTALEALDSADLFVLSSRNEAFSIALLEAGAFAKPIVATDVCGVAELIENEVTGLRVACEDPDALSEGILRMLGDREAAAECGRRLRALVRSRFTLEANCRSYLSLAGYLPLDASAKS